MDLIKAELLYTASVIFVGFGAVGILKLSEKLMAKYRPVGKF